MYYKGRGVPKDDVRAVLWYRKAAEQELADAQFLLGLMYADSKGVPKDDVKPTLGRISLARREMNRRGNFGQTCRRT